MINHFRELWEYRELIYNLVLRDLKVRYKNSLLGILWSWLNPLLMMLVFTFVFGIMRGATEGYHILVLSALLPWNYFAGAVMGGTTSIVHNGHLIKKVYFPREILPISVVLSNLVNFLISLPMLLLLALISGIPLTGWALLLPLPILIETLFIIGVVLILSTVEVFYRDTHMLMDVGILAWFFMTPIFYTLNELPQSASILWIENFNPQVWLYRLNPMASIINTYQDLLYRQELTALDFLGRTALTAVAIFLFGYWFFHRFSARFGEEV